MKGAGGPLLGIVVALPDEGRALLGPGVWRRDGTFRVRRGRLTGGTAFLCVRCGPGPGEALAAGRWLVARGATALASAGVAGALSPDLETGDLVVADPAREEDDDKLPRPVDACCAGAVLAALSGAGVRARRGAVLTVPGPVATAGRKEELFRRTGALAADMECAAAARAAREGEIPFFALRAVCDAARRSFPVAFFGFLGPGGRVRASALLRSLAADPSSAADLFRMRKDYAAALSALRRGWRALLRSRAPARIAGAEGP